MPEIRYHIQYDTKIYEKILELPKVAQQVILKNIENKLSIDPYAFGKPLRGKLRNKFRLRVGDYRVIYRVEDSTVTVLIIDVGHRKDIYD